MVNTEKQRNESAIGTDVVVTRLGPNVTLRNYLTDRPAPANRLRAAEGVLEVSIGVAHPVRKVWLVLKDFNAWMSRFGYVWDGLPADHQDRFVYLRNKSTADDLQYARSEDSRTKYVVRKVIPERLIYWDSVPAALPNKNGTFSGHNLVSLREENGQTQVDFFMEHTWYSETMTNEELRQEARWAMYDVAVAFWRDYLIPDLVSLIETGKIVATTREP